MQTHKRLIARILSFILTSSMVITTLPLNVLANEEVIESTEIIQEEGSNGSGEVSENTDGSEGNNKETVILGLEKAGAGTNQVGNDHDISTGDFRIFTQIDNCSADDPHVVTGQTTKYFIYVGKGTHFIELNGVDIEPSQSNAIGIASDATVNLILAKGSVNILKAGYGPGIYVPTRANLNISGEGELTSIGGKNSAGIGGGNKGAGGTITINAGTVIANGGSYGAGIGGGNEGPGGTININNGSVTANGGNGAAGIGGGFQGEGGTITINGGKVTATGGNNAAGIGGGLSGAGGEININNGTVSAKGGDYAAGIGGGFDNSGVTGGNITIKDGTVKATGGTNGAGIGGGQYGPGGIITIESGTITAFGGVIAAGIGGGNGGASGTITIKNGKVTATGGTDGGEGIGGFDANSNQDNQEIKILGGTIIAIGGENSAGIGCEEKKGAKGKITISDSANVTAVSKVAGRAIYAVNDDISPGTGTAAAIMQFNFGVAVGMDTEIEVKDSSGNSFSSPVSYRPAIDFMSIALTVPNIENYTAYAETDKLTHTVSSTSSDTFKVVAGLNNYTIVKEVTNTLNNIAVTAQPTKTTYTVGESFDKAGMVVEAAYSDGNKSTINNYTVNPSGALAATDTKVTISYTEGTITKTLDVTITVNEASHTHTPSTSWTSDATQHWHACIENDGGKMNMASHTFGEWVIDTPATDTQEGSKHRVCSICQYNERGTIPTLTPTPDTPSTGGSSSNSSNSSNNIGVEGVDTGKNVQVTTSRTPDIVKDVIDDKFIVGTFEIKKATEPVKITIKVDKKKTKDIFVLQSNPETGVLELLTKAEVNKDGKAEFTTDSKEKMTIVTQLYEGFIDTVATIEKPSVTYYVNEDQSFKKGWFLVDSKDWYFADYQSEIIHKGQWVADGQDNKKLANWYCLDEKGVMLASKWIANNENGSKWYYVDENGLFLRDTVIDGYVINEEGYWSK